MATQIQNETLFINGVPKVPTVFSWPSFKFPIEDTFDPVQEQDWLEQNWHTSIYWCTLYLVAISLGLVSLLKKLLENLVTRF